METSLLFALATFAFVSTVTPGPNNLMLLASGAQYGYKKSIPHMIGIVIGVAGLMISTLLGVGALFTLFPALYTVLKVLGITYLLWLAIKIATAPTDEIEIKKTTRQGPLKWWEGALFQLINPKAWMMALASVGTFTLPGEHYAESGLAIVLAFALIGFPCISIWAAVGAKIKIWLSSPMRRKRFNFTMAAATAATLFLIV
ncbi:MULTISPECIES: LysE family translocator [Alteromonas]|mgnify:FL=1|jgi:threonine/homoserine/homoserine lactone efflux protein|uniref:LysE family translocator n=1 Tax=Alteromonas stellipolaris TaxID=233316 RepID=A0AAW7Z6N2_9ALTE|nr:MULTISPECIES: LysE family translocator [Alteromonas]AMJ91591.1 lysine transporter LysE [Alteromonas sp. Mac2]ALM89583.1 Transporter, LysE [Alteromonas stellipolaris LMG 21856]AMJ75314.1 lysine transporter LysE [Alteromonas stellipolaris]AMJ87727.1 lysine transporter LysE [Alteromonas sp. Mac1]AMJ95446.1 lysine transporter LysE [Alteromonas stellipolaris]